MGVELPVPHAGIVKAGIACDMRHCVFRLDMSTTLADHDCKLSLEIELIGNNRPDQRCLVGQ
ncbi:hypothetical protein D9M70_592240 [compost metagenome]